VSPGPDLPILDGRVCEALAAGRAFADERRGTVRMGLDADLAVLDRDMLAGGPSTIIGTTVALTVVGGEVVHQTEGLG
jgi:predicted amidohydrolase YtcJ